MLHAMATSTMVEGVGVVVAAAAVAVDMVVAPMAMEEEATTQATPEVAVVVTIEEGKVHNITSLVELIKQFFLLSCEVFCG